jgi:hypothetical protein
MNDKRQCPRCGGEMPPDSSLDALSRVDNNTSICPACGLEEASTYLISA